MARKKKGGRRQQDDSDSDNAPPPQPAKNEGEDENGGEGEKKLSRKQLKQLKLQKKQQQNSARGGRGNDSDDEEDHVANLLSGGKNNYGDDSSEDDAPKPAKKLTKKQLKRQKEKEEAARRAAAAAMASDSEDEPEPEPQSESEEEIEIPQPVKKGKNKKKNKGKNKKQAFAAFDSDSEDEPEPKAESEEEIEIPQPVKKGKNKKKNKGKNKKQAFAAFDSDSEDELEPEPEPESEEEIEIPQPVKKGKNKKKNKGKGKNKKAAAFDSDSEDEPEPEPEPESEEEVEIPQPVKKGKNKKKNKGKNKKQSFAAFDSDSEKEPEPEPESEEEVEIPQPVKKSKKDKKKAAAAMKAAMFDSDSEDEAEPEPEPEPEEELAKEVEAMKIDDSDSDSDGKKKKKKKDKKKKDKKKDKKKESKDVAEGGDLDSDEEKARRKAERKAKKEAKEAKKIAKAMAKIKAAGGSDDEDGGENKKEEDEDGGVMYGAPDDHAWTDKSQAILDTEKKKDEGPDLSLIFDENGKKLSNKARKKILKDREAAARMAEYEKSAALASAEGAQFACSQTAINEKDPQWMNSLDINIPSFSISAAGKILFKDAEFNIAHGKRYGLVGPNGRGKSTLLKMIASKDLLLPPRVDFLYVEQEVVADSTSAVDAVLKADKKRWNLLEEEKKLTKAVDAGDESPKKLARLQEVYDELQAIGSDSAEAKARRILYGLGFDVEMQTKPTKMFSGGWRMRISLARALFIEPTLLMLDEPTNHLDLNAVIWLEDYLTRWKKTLLVVSHDQDFMNSICGEILHIEDLKLVSYKGDYDQFKKEQKTRLKQQIKAWEKQEKRLRELKRQGQSRAKANETVKKNKREPGARSQKKINDAIASGTASAEQKELIQRPREYAVKLEFTEVNELSRPVMEVNNVHFRYSPKTPVIFNEIDFGIDMDSRLCVVGPNGAGKSTLLKLLTGEIQATRGEVRRNPRLRMGIYNQHFVDRLPMDKTPVEHLRDRFQDEDYQSVRNRLGKYGLEGHAHEVVMRDLSGGQKARVVFVDLALSCPHILLLDEPTNNLDIETIDALIDAMNAFNGGIVVVTHDQRLIEYCDCELWVVEKESVTKWTAGFDDYKESLLREMEERMDKEGQIRKQKLEAAAKEKADKLAQLAAKLRK